MTTQLKAISIALSGILLSACGGGSSNGDTGSEDTLPTQKNTLPNAIAGENSQVLEGNTATLSAKDSFDSDGVIRSYFWKQLESSAPYIELSQADSAEASFIIPKLAFNANFEFELTVTDNKGGTSKDTVTITGRPTPSVHVGEIKGNTASYNATAEFSVRLGSTPSSNVTIPLASNDLSEGKTNVPELTFTPDNWSVPQTVTVRGTNADVVDGVQDYQVVLGETISSDPFYQGIDPSDIALRGVELTISEPNIQGSFVSGIESTIEQNIVYTGSKQLSFSLLESPSGMEIDLSTGFMTWLPEPADQGLEHTVTVAVNDSHIFKEVTFTLQVATPTEVNTVVSEDRLEVKDNSTSLDGLVLSSAVGNESTGYRLNSSAPSIIQTIDTNNIPALPTNVTAGSDAFVINTPILNKTLIEFPIRNIPVNHTLRDIELFRLSTADNRSGSFWSPVFANFSFGGTESNRTVRIELDELHGLYFFGFQQPFFNHNSQEESSNNVAYLSRSPNRQTTPSSTLSTISCAPKNVLPEDTNGEEYRLQLCKDSEHPSIEITVKNYGLSDNATQWGNVKIEDMASWLIESQSDLDTLGLSYDDKFNVALFNEQPDINNFITLGYVTTRGGDNRKTLFLNNFAGINETHAKTTAVHEYFHHAQSRSGIEGQEKLIDQGRSGIWLIEGTARWFEDRVYDNLNSYTGTGNSRFLEKGLASSQGNIEPYQRFTYFKLLESKCSNFNSSYINFINIGTQESKNGLASFVNELTNADCDFGAQFGTDKTASLASSLAYYSYASMFEKKLSLMDSNESDTFRFELPSYQFDKPWYPTMAEWLTHPSTERHTLNGISLIPSAGAFSFIVPSILGDLPEGKVAELLIESNREVLASITSSDNSFVGTNNIGSHQHSWFSSQAQSSYVYMSGNKVPELFITLVNPSLTDLAETKVYFRIRDELNVDTIINSHVSGDTVSNRVITVSGHIPEEAREVASYVTVSTNGIVSKTTLNQDGTFSAEVVVSLGNNIIKAQAFDGVSPITNEEVITIVGEENSLSGRNALVPSRAVYVLRWNTNATDIDIYSTDHTDATIWYASRTQGLGNLDYDDVNGYGPEVVSYRTSNNNSYSNGSFDLDVHYYRGSPATSYTLDIILNETKGANRRAIKFESTTPLVESNSGEDSPSGVGTSRHNDVLSIACSSLGTCSLSRFDSSKLKLQGSVSQASSSRIDTRSISSGNNPLQVEKEVELDIPLSVSDRCNKDLSSALMKSGETDWACDEEGKKVWH